MEKVPEVELLWPQNFSLCCSALYSTQRDSQVRIYDISHTRCIHLSAPVLRNACADANHPTCTNRQIDRCVSRVEAIPDEDDGAPSAAEEGEGLLLLFSAAAVEGFKSPSPSSSSGGVKAVAAWDFSSPAVRSTRSFSPFAHSILLVRSGRRATTTD